MNASKQERQKAEIAKRLKELRKARRLTQADLAKALGISQGWYSTLEKGAGSLTAEQFLEVLRIFNVPAGDFAIRPPKAEDLLQNTLARLGASHLHENDSILPSEALLEPAAAIKEVLLGAESPRQITSLAPVLVNQARHLNLAKLWSQLSEFGFENRLGWVVENTVAALRLAPYRTPSGRHLLPLRATDLIFHTFLERFSATSAAGLRGAGGGEDVFPALSSVRSIPEDRAKSSDISKKWGIVSRLQPEDFAQALEASRDAR